MRSLAEPLGFTTLASFEKFVKKCDPHAKIYFNISHERACRVLRLIEKEYTMHNT